jgi:hypothetical protein
MADWEKLHTTALQPLQILAVNHTFLLVFQSLYKQLAEVQVCLLALWAEPLAPVLVKAPHNRMTVVTVAVEPMTVKIQVCAVQAVAVAQGALVMD